MGTGLNRPVATPLRYDGVARFFHWAILALLIVEFTIAWSMPEVEKDTKPDGLIAWHLFFGTLILTVMLLRVFWRVSHPALSNSAQYFPLISAQYFPLFRVSDGYFYDA